METPPTIIVTIMAGLALAIAWLLVYFFADLCRKAWNWIDDNEQPVAINPIQTWLMRRMGYLPAHEVSRFSCYRWMTPDEKKRSDGEVSVFMPALFLLLAPTAIFAGLWLYPVTLAAITLFLIACVARFARRHRKLFDKHLKDPQAHK